MSYRPEGFKNIFNPAAIEARDRNNKPISHYDAFELSADAMLEALKKMGNSAYITTKITNNWDNQEITTHTAGTWVFIPDDKE